MKQKLIENSNSVTSNLSEIGNVNYRENVIETIHSIQLEFFSGESNLKI